MRRRPEQGRNTPDVPKRLYFDARLLTLVRMPSNAPSPRHVALALVAVAVVAAGVLALAPADSGADATAGQHIGHNASERLQSLEGLTATVETTLVRGNETDRTVRRVSMRPGTGEVRSEPVGGNGSVVVSNGTVMWLYDPADREATRLEVSGIRSTTDTQGERIERLFNRLNVSRAAAGESETAPPSPRLVPLPVVPAGPAAGAAPEGVNRTSFGVRYEGTDTVDGRETYVLTLTTGADGGANLESYTQRMYVDAEWFVPLRTHTEWTLDGERVTVTSVYRNVTFEPGLSDSVFRFDPPENVTVTEGPSVAVEAYDSVGALEENTSVSVPDPDVPPSFDLETARSTAGEGRSVSLQYANATSRLTVSKSVAANATNGTAGNVTGDGGERVTVGGQEGVYRQVATSRLVSWSCDGVRYTVSGTGVSRGLVLEVADSVGCG